MKRQGLRLCKRKSSYQLFDKETNRPELPGKLLALDDIERLLFAGRRGFAGYIPEAEMIRPPHRADRPAGVRLA